MALPLPKDSGFDDDKENYGRTCDVDSKMKIDVTAVVKIAQQCFGVFV